MAASLVRWDPFRDLAGFRQAMDRMFEDTLGRASGRNSEDELGAWTLSIDVAEDNDEYVVSAAVPGVSPEDIEIGIDDDVLTISGEFEDKRKKEAKNYVRQELRYGSFRRSLRLPPTVDVEKAKAEFEHGMLTLHLPKRPEAKARSIKITPQGVLEGSKAAK